MIPSRAAVDEVRGLAAGILDEVLDAADLGRACGVGADLDARLGRLRDAALALTRAVGLAGDDDSR